VNECHNVHVNECGVALVSRIDEIIGLFCKRALQKRQCSAKRSMISSILLTVGTPWPKVRDLSLSFAEYCLFCRALFAQICDMTHSHVQHNSLTKHTHTHAHTCQLQSHESGSKTNSSPAMSHDAHGLEFVFCIVPSGKKRNQKKRKRNVTRCTWT